MSKPGLRVVRGPNWCWGIQDGGEGYVGTVRDINLPGTPNKTVIVHWDNGSQLNCRIGHQDKYDLRIIDNAQIGAKHRHTCDVCETNIDGMRYHCISCYDYDLCYKCYHGDKHDITHSFKRFDDTSSVGVNLPPRFNGRKCQLKGIFKDALVARGFDWQWGNQDGGQGKVGTVLDIRGWENTSKRSTANIKWHFGNTDVYRIGHKGYCDIQCVEPSSGGEYYPEHLPILGQREEEMEWNGILDAIDRQQITELGDDSSRVQESNNQPKEINSFTSLDAVNSTYASLIVEDNVRICSNLSFNSTAILSPNATEIVDKFCKASLDFKDKEIQDMWNIIKCMTRMLQISPLENIVQVKTCPNFIKSLISRGKVFLEDSFKIYMANLVKEDIQLPQDDLPGVYRLVHSFVGLRFENEYLGLQDGTVDNRPLWPMVYYCLRSGDISAAVYCLRQNNTSEAQEILHVIEKRQKEPWSTEMYELEKNLRHVYQTGIRNCTDPFKRIIWAILGCYDEISESARTLDDYLWFKLCLAHFSPEEEGYIKYEDLQYMLLEEQGEQHYDAFKRPFMYFKILMLTGQFEAALEFLFRTEKFKVHAVHMAIILNKLNLLAYPRDPLQPLISMDISDPRTTRRLNFVLMVKNYAKSIEAKSLNAAMNYYFLLRAFANEEKKNMFIVVVADLILRTKEYVPILGKFEQSSALGHHNRNFYRTTGLLDQFTIPNLFLDIVTEIKSQITENNHNWEELLDFYVTVNDQESILHFMCSMLCQVADLESNPESLRNKLQEKADAIAEEYSRIGYFGHQSIYLSFNIARGLLTFFDLYRGKRYSEALRTVAPLQLVPLKLEELERTVYKFPALNEDLAKVVPNLLLAIMSILTRQCDKIKRASDANQQQLRWIWEQANTITNFAERLPEEIMGSILDRLVAMEILLHS